MTKRLIWASPFLLLLVCLVLMDFGGSVASLPDGAELVWYAAQAAVILFVCGLIVRSKWLLAACFVWLSLLLRSGEALDVGGVTGLLRDYVAARIAGSVAGVVLALMLLRALSEFKARRRPYPPVLNAAARP
jgi:hypothetical protein